MKAQITVAIAGILLMAWVLSSQAYSVSSGSVDMSGMVYQG